MFSPLGFQDGAIIYDLITHAPSPSHLALTPFDLYREPLFIIAIADGAELNDETFSKRHSANGTAPTTVERNLRALHQELEDLRDNYPKGLVHQVLLFDYDAGSDVPVPDGIQTIPPLKKCKRTTIKTIMCNISSLLLAEMTTLAKSFEAMTTIESPGHYYTSAKMNGEPASSGPTTRRNSQFSLPQHLMRSSSVSGALDKSQARMSMPPVPTRSPSNASSTGTARPSTPTNSDKHGTTPSEDGISNPASPEPKIPRSESASANLSRDTSRDRVSVQGFGPGGANDKWRLRGKGRASIVIGSLYLQAGRWSDSLRELSEGATASRSLNDHIWHGKALELILMNLFLLGWAKLEFQVPAVCIPTQERPLSGSGLKSEPDGVDEDQPKHLRNLQTLLPELLERITNLYSRISSENLPPLPFSESIIRFCKILSAVHMCNGKLNERSLNIIVTGQAPKQPLTTSPRLTVSPTRQQIVNLLFKAFPSSATELLTTADRIAILSGIAAVLGPLGYQRKKAMVIRELVSVLIGGLVEARTRGAAEAGVHPAAGLVSITGAEQGGGTLALDLGEGDVEYGIEAFLEMLCRAYGVVGYDPGHKTVADAVGEKDDTDAAVLARIERQLATRLFGFSSIKLNILRACINFSEALPDFKGVLKFSSDLMRTAGSGVAPGPRREDASPVIHQEEQARLATSISRTWALGQRLGMTDVDAEYWDEFLVRGVEIEPLPVTRVPVPHARTVLPGASATRASQDVNPFIYNPFLKEPADAASDNIVAGEEANFKVTLQNTYDVEIEIEHIRLEASGVDFEPVEGSTVIGPYRTQVVTLKGTPKEAGTITVTGAFVKVRGCRGRRFPILAKSCKPIRADKIKARGVASLENTSIVSKTIGRKLEVDTLQLQVIPSQPLLVIKSTSLSQSSVMILEGERQIFTVTLQNLSSTPVDFVLFSFKDSTQAPLQTALSNHQATPAELYEYELILMKKQALRLPRDEQNRCIAPGAEAVFEFEIFGKPGLTNATIQVDYTHLGVPRDEITDEFYTRQVSLDLAVTVNASVELTRIDALPLHGEIPKALWDRMGGKGTPKADEYCLLSMDLRNSWPSQMSIRLEGQDEMMVEENILPGKTARIVLPIKRVFLEEPHTTIPSLNPSRKRQFIVSASKITPEMERGNREAFWYRERILDTLRATWQTTSAPRKNGVIDLRNIRLTPRMIEYIRIEEVHIQVSMQPIGGGGDSESDSDEAADINVGFVDEFMQMNVCITNRTNQPILPMVRLVPALCHRPLTVALDYTRKFGWNGTLQQLLPELGAHSSIEFVMGVTGLCRGEFEVTATVEEVFVTDETQEEKQKREQRHRSGSQQQMLDAAVGIKQRRMWHSRKPLTLIMRDRD